MSQQNKKEDTHTKEALDNSQPLDPEKLNNGSTDQSAKATQGRLPSSQDLKGESASKSINDFLTSPEKKNEEESNCEQLITLSQYFEQQDKEEKIQRKILNGRYANTCRYQEGYIYQQVYSCITCYQDQIRNLPQAQREEVEKGLASNGELVKYIKPHGFCLGCMINCHQGHEIRELYSKLDFRCDCGNLNMPYTTCEQKKDLEFDLTNDKNVYNQTFFDSYCYCKKPHSFEEMDQYMIECYECQDWYHNQHTNPVLKEQLDDKYILLCRNCVDKNFLSKIQGYGQFMHPKVREAIGNSNLLERSAKRLKLSEEAEAQKESYSQVNCKSDGPSPALEVPLDIILDEAFVRYVCECDECQQIFNKVKRHVEAIENMDAEEKELLKYQEGELSEIEESDNEEAKEPNQGGSRSVSEGRRNSQIPSSERLNQMFNQTVAAHSKSMSHESQIFLAENLCNLRDKMTAFLKSFDSADKHVTKDDVQTFFQELEEEKNTALARHLEINREPK